MSGWVTLLAFGPVKAYFNGDVDIGGIVNANAMRAIGCPEFIDKTVRLAPMDKQGGGGLPVLGAGV